MMGTNPEIPLGSRWRERARPGHTVEVVEVVNPQYGYYNVHFQHLTAHNKRFQRYPTKTTEANFLRRYERISVSTPDGEIDLVPYEDQPETEGAEQSAPLEVTRLYLSSMDERMVKFDDVTQERRRQLLMSDPRTMSLHVRPDHWEKLGRPVELIMTLENGK